MCTDRGAGSTGLGSDLFECAQVLFDARRRAWSTRTALGPGERGARGGHGQAGRGGTPVMTEHDSTPGPEAGKDQEVAAAAPLPAPPPRHHGTNDPAKWGRVDADGTVYVKTGDTERAIRSWQGGGAARGAARPTRAGGGKR